jgi:hypothetical protein
LSLELVKPEDPDDPEEWSEDTPEEDAGEDSDAFSDKETERGFAWDKDRRLD